MWKRAARDEDDNTLVFPPWKLVLAYAHAIRKKALQLVTEGKALKDALKVAWEDKITKERNFTTPLALNIRKSVWTGIGIRIRGYTANACTHA